MSADIVIRDARPGDEDAIVALLRDFAEFEHLTHTFRLTPEIVRKDFIGADRRVECEVAEMNGETIAVMIWYRSYSTFQAASGIFLEDIFVHPEFRGRGVGTTMLRHLAHRASQAGVTKIEWSVLDWNEVAIDFYVSLRAQPVSGWQTYRLAGEALQQLADA